MKLRKHRKLKHGAIGYMLKRRATKFYRHSIKISTDNLLVSNDWLSPELRALARDVEKTFAKCGPVALPWHWLPASLHGTVVVEKINGEAVARVAK